ncbi:MAG TPA: hypothetical protein ENG76_04920, partial [Nitrospirae bacterium]|nr:hypothetical protein [Nitrospirota bacterium]
MSFILDALKNLEEKHQKAALPNLMTIHTDSRIEQGKRPLLTYLLVAVLLINAGIFAVWLRPQQKENIENPVPSAPIIDETATKKDALHEQEVVKATPAPNIAITENRKVAIETSSLPINPSPEEIIALKNEMAKEHLLINTSASFKPALEEESSSAAERTVPDMSQLPISIRNALPDLTITGHIYSNDPMSRIVNI